MAIERTVRVRGGQYLVAVPAEVRRHLGVAQGVAVYWSMPRQGEARVSVKRRVAHGPKRAAADCSSCAAYRKEIERLSARLQARPAADVREGINQLRQQWFAHHDLGPGWASRIETRLDELAARMPYRGRGKGPHAVVIAGDVSKVGAPTEEHGETLAEGEAVTDSGPVAVPDLAEAPLA